VLLYILLIRVELLSIDYLAYQRIQGMERLAKVRVFSIKIPILIYLDQALVILPLLRTFSINESNIGFFVLDNATNNNTILIELAKELGFDLKERRLRCIGHIINLIAEQYLFGQDSKSFNTEFQAVGEGLRRQL